MRLRLLGVLRKCEEAKGINRSRKLKKNRQHIDQNKKDRKIYNDQITLHRKLNNEQYTKPILKTVDEISGMVISSCFTCGTRNVTLVKDPEIYQTVYYH